MSAGDTLDEAEGASFAFAQALYQRDVDAATACFAADARLVTPDGTVVQGREEIRGVIQQLLLLKGQLRVEVGRMLMVGKVALGSERWTMRFEGLEGVPYEQITVSTTVYRHSGCRWELLIAAPWGWEQSGAQGYSDSTFRA